MREYLGDPALEFVMWFNLRYSISENIERR